MTSAPARASADDSANHAGYPAQDGHREGATARGLDGFAGGRI